MASTEKISVAKGRDELRLAKTAAEKEGISLSAFVTKALRDRLEEQRRMAAAKEVLGTFGPDDFPTPEEERELLALWSTPRKTPESAPQFAWVQIVKA
jgi:hypothetical protein